MSKIFKANTVSYNADRKFIVESTAEFLREAAEELEAANAPEDDKEAHSAAPPKVDPLETTRVLADEMIRIARENADMIVSKANREAQAIQIQSNADALELFEGARKDGYEKGYSEGEQDAQVLRDEAEDVLRDAEEQREEMLAGVEEEIVELISGAVKKILGAAYEIDRNTVVCLIRNTLAEITVTESIKINVSKDDYEDVLNRRDEIAASALGAEPEFGKNLSLGKGDCVIETAFGNIDCGLDGQFTKLQTNLRLVYEGKRI
jgi:flagellar assembly protein FliH